MISILNFNSLFLANLVLLGCLFAYLTTKIRTHRTVVLLVAALVPLFSLELGSYLFGNWLSSPNGARLIILAIALMPIAVVPVSHCVGRTRPQTRQFGWWIYYVTQTILLLFIVQRILAGEIIQWVTGILDEPIIIVDDYWRYYFLNIIGSSVLALLSFDKTLQKATRPQQDELKFVFVAFLGFTVYFSYLATTVLLSSYISLPILQLGAAIVFPGLLLLAYGFAKYPLWEIKIRVSRRLVFGTLTATAALIYLIISGSILNLLRLAQTPGTSSLLPIVGFALVALFLFAYLSANFHSSVKSFVTRNFFHNKYDYRDLWMKFSEKSSGSLNIRDILPPVADFIADAMFVRQVTFWLRSATSDTYLLTYCRDAMAAKHSPSTALRLNSQHAKGKNIILPTGSAKEIEATDNHPTVLQGDQALLELGIKRLVLVEKGDEVLAVMGVGPATDKERSAAEDEQFLSSVSSQLSHLILTHKLSEELLLAREWDSFNRFASFILHDLKNLATLQGMTLDNAKKLGDNPRFIADAFATFSQTTEKMINLITSLSVQRGEFSLRQQPVNILEVIAQTFDDLKIDQNNGLKVKTVFPPKHDLPVISGDPELLQKAFTNLLLNAIQSLPQGKGAVEVTVAQEPRGMITTSIRDNGCGIAPERIESLFRPFQTTKEQGLGIGLCHTRSIIEVHGGQIRIESEINAGTRVEVALPAL